MSSMTTATGSRLQGKIAAVFGAGGEIGAAVAKEFAAQGGAPVPLRPNDATRADRR
jgi:NAD(P)-dependent dehydrogenase (short-subunit alcohol dehydrogenase family)